MVTKQNIIIDYLDKIHHQLNQFMDTSLKLDNVDTIGVGASYIRSSKADMATALNTNTIDLSTHKHYIRNESRIILSAPEIIIGDIDKNGNLLPSSGNTRVVIRSNSVELDGVGKDDSNAGRVVTRASKIHNIAVDPGIDGKESYLKSCSEILSVSKGYEVRCEDEADSFTRNLNSSVVDGINFRSAKDISIRSTVGDIEKKSQLTSRKEIIDADIIKLNDEINKMISPITKMLERVREISKDPIYETGELMMAIEYKDYDNFNRRLESYTIAILQDIDRFFKKNSELFELKRERNSIINKLKSIEQEALLTSPAPTSTSITLSSPNVVIKSDDIDNNNREDGSILLRSHNIDMQPSLQDESAFSKSRLNLKFNGISLDTSTPSFVNGTNKFTSAGTIDMRSAAIKIDGFSREKKGDATEAVKVDTTTPTSLNIEMGMVNIDTSKFDGTNDGSFSVNSKNMMLRGTTTSSEGKATKSEESILQLMSNNIVVGKINKEKEAIYSDSIRLEASTAIVERSGSHYQAVLKDLYSDDAPGNAISWAHDSNFDLCTSKPINATIGGKTKVAISSDNVTIYPEITAKSKITGTDIEAKNLVVTGSYDGPCTKEGISTPAVAPVEPSASVTIPKPKNEIDALVPPPSIEESKKAREEYVTCCNNLNKLSVEAEDFKRSKNHALFECNLYKPKKLEAEARLKQDPNNSLIEEAVSAWEATISSLADKYKDELSAYEKKCDEVKKAKSDAKAALNKWIEADKKVMEDRAKQYQTHTNE